MGEPRVWKAMGMGQVTRHQVRLLILDAPSQPTGEGIGPIPAILGVFLSLLAASALGQGSFQRWVAMIHSFSSTPEPFPLINKNSNQKPAVINSLQ
jgi:hypothetical protein